MERLSGLYLLLMAARIISGGVCLVIIMKNVSWWMDYKLMVLYPDSFGPPKKKSRSSARASVTVAIWGITFATLMGWLL